MTVKEAYEKVIQYFDGDDSGVPVIIREYNKLFAFVLAPKWTTPGEAIFVGPMICVMKDNGEVIPAIDLEDRSFYREPWDSIDPKEVLG